MQKFIHLLHKIAYPAEVGKTDFKVDGFEIAKAGWFALKSLPENRTKRTDIILEMAKNVGNGEKCLSLNYGETNFIPLSSNYCAIAQIILDR